VQEQRFWTESGSVLRSRRGITEGRAGARNQGGVVFPKTFAGGLLQEADAS